MKHSLYQRIILLSIAATGFLFVLGAAFPGFMTSDSVDQYEQAVAGTYTDWHPPFMAWLWHQLLVLKKGSEPMLFLNLIVYWTSIAVISHNIRKFPLALLFSIVAFAPPLINFLGVIWKDTLLFAILCLHCGLLLYINAHPLKKLQKILVLLLICCLSFCGMLIRYNAAPAVLPLLAAGIHLLYTPKNIFRSLLASLVLCLLAFWGTGKINDALCRGRHSQPIQQLMLYDLMGIAKGTGENVFPNYLHEKLNVDTLPKVYSPYDGAMVAIFDLHCRTVVPGDFESLKAVWLDQIRLHPWVLLRHKILVYNKLIQEPGLCTFRGITENKAGIQSKVCPLLNRWFIRYTENAAAFATYKPVFYLFLCIAICALAGRGYFMKGNPDQAFPMLVALSGVLYSACYLLLSPCNDFRYHYWTIGSGFISIFLWLNALRKNK